MVKASMKPYFVAIIVQLIYTGMFVISKAAFNHGMNTYIFIFYRQAVGSLILLPAALLQRKSARQVMTLGVLIKLFFCALIGITLGVNLYHVSLKFTSATVASAVDSSLPAITFFLAVLLRTEYVKLRSSSGIAKVTSVALCLAGVFTIAFFAGPSISPINHHRAFASDAGSKTVVPRGVWIKWTFLMVVANMCWSLWIIFQAAVQKEYPDKMIVTLTQCLFSTVQSFVVAVVAERDFSKWKLRFDISLLAILYSGVMVTGVSYYLQTWCLEMRGPMFFASWTPLCFVFTIFCSSFFLGEIVHLGSILGGILLVGSLYTMLWGKSKEGNETDDVTDDDIEKSTQIYPGEQQHTTTDQDKESTLIGSAALHAQEL
ncbi:WAT1-related protein At5g64700-like [Oryza glaberrima]|uniref:WAT1-related protein n=1 Tax=Oryza glaberrima TaxID=4538 RepID=I1R6R5_ORYGL|nr:WAT1-related protein At5g64700-like [Oryza glaberrima]